MVLTTSKIPSQPFTLNVEYGDENRDVNGRHSKKSTQSQNRYIPMRTGMPFAANSTKHNHHEKRAGWSSSITRLMIIGVLCYFYHNNSNALKAKDNEISTFTADFDNVRGVVEEIEGELESAHGSFHNLKSNTLATSTHLEDYVDYDEDYYYYDILSDEERKNVAKDIIDKHDKQVEHIDSLKRGIQNFHRKELERRYGEGPYRVEFEIKNNGKTDFFTVQTAPNELMPHSVYTFMQMVDEGVWDNTVFIHHWNHIVQAAPISPDGENKRDSINGVLSFPEYSDEYKHEQYTLGFSGRPGGPEFYINLDDNDDTHGPGKQEHSTVLNDADPCFAKVVIGKRAVDRLQKTSIEVINEADSDDADSGIAFSSIVSVNLVVSKEKNRRKKITSFDPRFKSGFFAQG